MESNKSSEVVDEAAELPDSWWHKVYAAVIVVTVLVVIALWSFTRFFS